MNILFITYNRLGDAVLSTGLLGHLLDRYPEARFTVACGPVPAPLFRPMPRLARLIVIEKQPRLGHWRQLWRATAGTRWDLVVDLRGSALAWCLRARRRIVARDRAKSRHRIDFLGSLLGLQPPPAPRLWSDEAERAAARGLLPDGRRHLVIAPTANWGGKRWPAERFAELARRLTAPGGILPGAHVAVCAAGFERAQAEPVLQALPAGHCVDLVGNIDLPTLHACLQRADFFVGNDSGLMHMAAASGTPTLGLFGPSREELYRPWGENCATVRTEASYDDIVGAPGYDYRSQESRMLDLSVDKVEDAARRLFDRVGKDAA